MIKLDSNFIEFTPSTFFLCTHVTRKIISQFRNCFLGVKISDSEGQLKKMSSRAVMYS